MTTLWTRSRARAGATAFEDESAARGATSAARGAMNLDEESERAGIGFASGGETAPRVAPGDCGEGDGDNERAGAGAGVIERAGIGDPGFGSAFGSRFDTLIFA